MKPDIDFFTLMRPILKSLFISFYLLKRISLEKKKKFKKMFKFFFLLKAFLRKLLVAWYCHISTNISRKSTVQAFFSSDVAELCRLCTAGSEGWVGEIGEMKQDIDFLNNTTT